MKAARTFMVIYDQIKISSGPEISIASVSSLATNLYKALSVWRAVLCFPMSMMNN